MAHKGRLYPINQDLRIVGGYIWALYPAKVYTVSVDSWRWMGVNTTDIDTGPIEGYWVGIDPVFDVWSYRASFANTLGHLIEGGFQFTWDNATQLSTFQWQLWLDGVASVSINPPHAAPDDWDEFFFTWGAETFSTPLSMSGHMHVRAVRW